MPNKRNIISQEEVKNRFTYFNGFIYRNGKKVGSKTTNGYLTVCVNYTHYQVHRLIFLFHHGYMPDFVDHEDRNKLNNKINNLREADASKNSCNSKCHSDSSSRYIGVHWANKRYWRVMIKFNGKQKHIGLFKDEVAAALAYNREAVRHHGEFANLNIINT